MTARTRRLLLALSVSCVAVRTAPAGSISRPCDAWAHPPERVGATPPALRELSGLVASHRHPGIFWGHNDSDNAFEVIAIRETGAVVATFRIDAVSATDVEDIARGPCQEHPDQTCLFLADIGDNLEVRSNVQLFEVPEPTELRDGTLTPRRLPFRYADGAHNAEALLVDGTGATWVVTKRLDDLGRLYRLDGMGVGRTGTARFVRRLRAPSGFGALTTGGDVHPAGGRVLLRTYTSIWEYRGASGDGIEAILATTPVDAPVPRQPQSEAIAYTPDGRGYLVGSEKSGAPLYRVRCLPAPE